MKPKKPAPHSRWKSLGRAPVVRSARVYRRGHLQVFSTVEAGEWHVSVSSMRMGMVSDAELERVRADFGMQGATASGGVLFRSRVRHLWLPALEMAG